MRGQANDGFHALGVGGVDVEAEVAAQFGKRCRGGTENAAFQFDVFLPFSPVS